MTRADVLAAWVRAIMEAPGGSWRDREAVASAPLTLESLGHLCVATEDFASDATSALQRRLHDLGFRGGVYDRHVEVRTHLPWFVAPLMNYDSGGPDRVHWCNSEVISEHGSEWFASVVDLGAHEADRLQSLDGDISVALTDGGGMLLLTTSLRVAPRRLR